MDLLKHGRDGKKGEKTGEGKEKEGFLETGLQRLTASWNEQGQTEPGKDRQQIGVDRQMGKEDIMTKIRENPAGQRQTRGAGEERQKEKRKQG